MNMENHHHHHHEQQQQNYDLRQLMNLVGKTTLTTHFPTPAELFPAGNQTYHHHDMMMFGRQVSDIIPHSLHEFVSTDHSVSAIAAAATTPTATTSASTPSFSGNLEAETNNGCIGSGVDGSTGRWPRQETLTLLEIRSRLHPQFKDATQKGPLWDQLSRIMCEEHGYQRSGKKCREKFENLCKYYKKTKEGKAGRQDGKNYRFFRQLEAICGTENNINNPSSSSISLPQNNFCINKKCDSLSLTNSTEFDTSSSSDQRENECSMEKRKKRVSGRTFWKVKIKDFFDSQMKKLVEKQEEWLEKLTKTLEEKEKERVLREQDWRKQENERLEKEHKFWAKERAWIEARDAALMEALQKLTNDETLKTTQMSCHDGNKKRKEEISRSCFYFDDNNNVDRSCLYNVHHHNGGGGSYCGDVNEERQEHHEHGRVVERNDGSLNSNNVVVGESCFPLMMSNEGGNFWENYSLKVNKPNQNQ